MSDLAIVLSRREDGHRIVVVAARFQASLVAPVAAYDRATLTCAINRLLSELDYTGSTRARLSRGHDHIGWVTVAAGRAVTVERPRARHQ